MNDIPISIGFSISFVSLLLLAYFFGRLENRVSVIEKEAGQLDGYSKSLTQLLTTVEAIQKDIDEIRNDFRELRARWDGKPHGTHG